MKKHIKEIILILSVVVCSVIVLEYSRKTVVSMRQNQTATNIISESVSENTAFDSETYNNEDFFPSDLDIDDDWGIESRRFVDRWWIETKENSYANSKGCRITYADGYYYYASQLDHYYLYRAKEDGSDSVCLAKVHPGAIQTDTDAIYFVNLSDYNAIYRIDKDGSNMVKLCDSSDNHMQLTEEYIYFCSSYDKAYDIRGLVDPEHDMTGYHPSDGYLYRIRKDGTGKELILTDVEDYILAQAAGNNVIYEGNIYCKRLQQNETTRQWEAIVTVYDLDGNNLNESYLFDFYGEILVSNGQIYCFGYGNSDGNICMYTTWNNEMTTLPDQLLTDYCIYNDTLYGLKEEVDHEKRITQIYSFSPDTNDWQLIYNNTAICTASGGNYNDYRLTDLYATEHGVFLRQFVSSEEGVRWFAVGEKETVTSWEDETNIPTTQPAVELKYAGDSSIKSSFQSTDGYEDYLGKDLTYQTFYAKDEAGNSYCPYTVCLPQFNEKVAGYQKINKYFQDAYQESVETMQAEFVEKVKDEKTTEYDLLFLYEGTSYDYVYIGEKYITVAMYQYGYDGGIRSWTTENPVTFERDTGKVVTLEDLYGMPADETVSYITASIYKYAESIGRGSEAFFMRDKDILTEKYDPKQFFLFPEGIGLYYPIYAIDCGAAGDYVFIIPFPD